MTTVVGILHRIFKLIGYWHYFDNVVSSSVSVVLAKQQQQERLVQNLGTALLVALAIMVSFSPSPAHVLVRCVICTGTQV